MKKGFTLAELLGVVVIISLLAIVLLPPIINQVKKNTTKISDSNLELIYTATEIYLDYHANDYNPEDSGASPVRYCITLQQLVDDNRLKEPIYDVINDVTVPLSKNVEVTIDKSTMEYSYLLKDTCTPTP